MGTSIVEAGSDSLNRLTLFTYKFRHPRYHQWVVLDCAAPTRELALASALRFLKRENRALARVGKWRCQLPTHVNHMRSEPSPPD